MANEWRQTTLDQLGRIVTGKTPPSSRPGNFGGDIPFITPSDFDDGRLISKTMRSLSQEGIKRVSGIRIPGGSVIVSCIGSDMGKAAIAAHDSVTNQQVNSIIVNSGHDPLFLYYNLSARKSEIQRAASGSAQPILNKTSFGQLQILLPPRKEQSAIAQILGTLDDKIEMNRRKNETLEAIARAVFKSWFVDFDPVHAKAEGRDTGLPKEIADLFPNSLVNSALGEIPKGWRMLPLAECVDAARGLSYKGSGLSDSGLPMHNLNSIYEGGGYKHEGIKHYEGDYRPHHVARAGDLIVANTEQGHNRLLIGYAAIVPARFDGESLFSHHIYRVRPRSSSGLTPDYLCHLLNTSVMHDTVSGYANGTTVNMLPIDGLQSPFVVVPPSVIVRAFDGFAEAARKRHGEMMDESRTLAALRDTLLPRLISGVIRVRNAERMVAEVGS